MVVLGHVVLHRKDECFCPIKIYVFIVNLMDSLLNMSFISPKNIIPSNIFAGIYASLTLTRAIG